MIAFVVAALMGIMLIHILMESIPALREVGIKMFLPSSEWRPVSAAPQYGLLPAVTGTLYVPAFLLFSCQRNLHLSAWPL